MRVARVTVARVFTGATGGAVTAATWAQRLQIDPGFDVSARS